MLTLNKKEFCIAMNNAGILEKLLNKLPHILVTVITQLISVGSTLLNSV